MLKFDKSDMRDMKKSYDVDITLIGISLTNCIFLVFFNWFFILVFIDRVELEFCWR
jgi:hypothetical protein